MMPITDQGKFWWRNFLGEILEDSEEEKVFIFDAPDSLSKEF